jgi:hypothetical protein
MEKMEDGIKAVLGGILADVSKQNQAVYDQWAEQPGVKAAVAAVKIANFSEYSFHLLYPMEKLVNGLLESVFPGKSRLQMLVRDIKFFEQHFGAVIKEVEGWSCYVDKQNKVLRSLARFLGSGQEIVWDYEAEYTYNLPRKVFTTHQGIVDYFDALADLLYGNPEKYIVERQKIDRLKAAA